jgi:hypothetical protein
MFPTFSPLKSLIDLIPDIDNYKIASKNKDSDLT